MQKRLLKEKTHDSRREWIRQDTVKIGKGTLKNNFLDEAKINFVVYVKKKTTTKINPENKLTFVGRTSSDGSLSYYSKNK